MSMNEQALVFDCAGSPLVGILSRPTQPVPGTTVGVVIVVGGLQYRIGSHRQFVLLARKLAQAGHVVLRFDVRGMGDSGGASRAFESLTPDIDSAIGALQQAAPHVKTVALWGLCDGASASLLYCHETHDPRVVGLCLLNPWVRSESSLARTHVKHYYPKRFIQGDFWRRLMGGKITWRAMTELASNLRLMRQSQDTPGALTADNYQTRMAKGWHSFSGHILLLLSSEDLTAREFIDYANANSHWGGHLTLPRVQHKPIPNADHTFSDAVARLEVEALSLDWLRSLPT
jgi:exosortase A-associated hydrolase 1